MSNFDMKIGEYFLHILIEETIGLAASDEEKTTDPKVKIEAMDTSKYSTVKKLISSDTKVYWGEHFYFNKKYKSRDQLEEDLLVISVYDSSRLISSGLIGSFTVNIASIYFENNHVMAHKWFLLQNKDKNFDKVMGFVKMSFTVAFEGEPRVILQI